jgi:hypothetical protein
MYPQPYAPSSDGQDVYPPPYMYAPSPQANVHYVMTPVYTAPPAHFQVAPPAPIVSVQTPSTLSSDAYLKQKQLGSLSHFIRNQLVGFFIPVLSSLFVFSLETPLLSKVGNLFGNFNAWLWLGAYFVSIARFDEANQYCYNNSYYYNGYYQYDYSCPPYTSPFYYISIPFWIISLVFFICSIISYRRYTAEFRKRIDSTDAMRYAQGEKGCAGDFAIGFLVTLFIPVLGSAIVLACNRKYMARFGVALGLCVLFLVMGAVSIPFWYLSFITGNPCLFLGLFMTEIVVLHFHRVFMVINASPSTQNA